jgi:hypothetical protein
MVCDDNIPIGLNDNHKLRLRSTFKLFDEMLSAVARTLSASEPQSPFSDIIPDATPVQQRLVAEYAAQIRVSMLRILDEIGTPLPQPHISAVWSARTTLTSAAIDLEELKPKYMRGYGSLSEAEEKNLERFISELTDLFERLGKCLDQGK